MGTADIVKFKHDDSDSLITLILSTTVFGWSVGDLYIAPDHARYILQTDHHEVIYVSFRTPEEIERWA